MAGEAARRENRPGDYEEDTKHYHLYVQWIIQEQLDIAFKKALNGQLLYLDLPLGLHPDSYDVWRDRESFVRMSPPARRPTLFSRKGKTGDFLR